ncbi:MAG: SpoIID/LytB domain-containing protein [Cyanobacteriota bacterium]|nr:SpoIID/LytB domain-containing protein [Cyanobacteriota bacterium]
MMVGKLSRPLAVAASLVVTGGIPMAQATTQSPANPTLHIGLIQRFGEPDNSEVKLAAPGGAVLNLQFEGTGGKLETQPSSQVTIRIVNQSLATPEMVQRLILSSHKSFESAEASAQAWLANGIQTEIAQPDEWQVWAKRSAYGSEALGEILAAAQAKGIPTVRMFQEERPTQPQLSWVVDDFRYHRRHLTVTSSAGYLRVGDRTYAGSITIQPNAYGTYTVINSVPLETYLRGVVPHEVGPNAPDAAMAAQAILARTYALKNRHRFQIDGYHLSDDTHTQVYKGLTETTARTDAAIQLTRGQVLTYEGDLIDAVYSSTNGGMAAAFEDIWDGDPRPYLQPNLDIAGQPQKRDLSQADIFRQFIQQQEGFNETGVSRLFRWTISQTLDELAEQLRANQDYLGIPIPVWTDLANLKVVSRSASGRVQALQVDLKTADGVHSITLHKDQIRLGFRKLYSTMFDVDPIRRNDQLVGFTFVGGGFGHGVGLSQYGSYTLARLGYSPAQILSFYYPGTTLSRLGS